MLTCLPSVTNRRLSQIDSFISGHSHSVCIFFTSFWQTLLTLFCTLSVAHKSLHLPCKWKGFVQVVRLLSQFTHGAATWSGKSLRVNMTKAHASFARRFHRSNRSNSLLRPLISFVRIALWRISLLLLGLALHEGGSRLSGLFKLTDTTVWRAFKPNPLLADSMTVTRVITELHCCSFCRHRCCCCCHSCWRRLKDKGDRSRHVLIMQK